jgi:hypothetical protein
MQEFQMLRVLEPALRMKAQADSNSRGQKDFIYREFSWRKEKKDCILENAHGPGWGVGFYGLVALPDG